MTTLREKIRRLAEEASRKVHLHVTGDPRVIESAILAGIKLALEREPNEEAKVAGYHAEGLFNTPFDRVAEVYRAMTRELLKELD